MLKELLSDFQGRPLNLPHRTSPLAHSPSLVARQRLPARPHLPHIPLFPCPQGATREHKVVLVRLVTKTEKAAGMGPSHPGTPPSTSSSCQGQQLANRTHTRPIPCPCVACFCRWFQKPVLCKQPLTGSSRGQITEPI